MSQPISAGVICHSRTSTGSTNASDRASKASKNVALPTMMRARRCHAENGTASSRATSEAPSATREKATQLLGKAIGKLDRCQVSGTRNDRQRRLRNRVMEVLRHPHRRRVILLADDNGDRHPE